MPVVSVSMPDALLERLDEFAADNVYSGRSEVVRQGTKRLLTEFEADGLADGAIVASVSVFYDYGSPSVDRRLARLRRDRDRAIASNVHAHVGEYCLEVFVLEGDRETASTIVRRLRSIEGVLTVEYSLVPLGEVDRAKNG